MWLGMELGSVVLKASAHLLSSLSNPSFHFKPLIAPRALTSLSIVVVPHNPGQVHLQSE